VNGKIINVEEKAENVLYSYVALSLRHRNSHLQGSNITLDYVYVYS